MRTHKLSLEDGGMIRTLVDWPGGLELHIGVSSRMLKCSLLKIDLWLVGFTTSSRRKWK